MATVTPWGVSQDRYVTARGLTFHSTASHGGFLVGKKFAEKNLSAAAIKYGQAYGNYLAYEEDILANIILLEIPETRKDFLNPDHLTDENLIKSLSFYYPDYLIERGITPDPVGYAAYKQRKDDDRRRAEKCSNLIVSALGLDDKVVKVYTADEKAHFVTLESYRDRVNRDSNNLSDCVQVPDYVQTTYMYF